MMALQHKITKKIPITLLLCFFAQMIIEPIAYAQRAFSSGSNDQTFLALREASRSNNAFKAAELAQSLASEALLASYVDYYALKSRLQEASETEIRAYLNRYQGTAIADRLRNDWLLLLGKNSNWAVFNEQYPQFILNDNMQVKCYALLSRALAGERVAENARTLLTVTKDYGEACPALIETLARTEQFTQADIWTQIRLAAESGSSSLTRRLAPLTGTSESRLFQAMEQPEKMLNNATVDPLSPEIFTIVLGRAAKNNVFFAARALTKNLTQLSPSYQTQAWAAIALQASLKLLPEAVVYWRDAAGAALSNEGYQWKIRTALRAGDWKMVKAGIEAMPSSLQNEPTWVYWLGRALKAEKRQEDALTKFQQIAAQYHFYGQLALEELGQKINIPPRAQPATAQEIATVANNQGFARAIRFFDLNLSFEGAREWNWELRKMNERQLLAAAEFARQNNLLDRMINTSDRTKTEFDFNQRFPSPFYEIMAGSTQKRSLDIAWVYGLIRQESRFIQYARSHVGASGLMQIMPATARFVARKMGLTNFTPDQINNINTNIELGTHYLMILLADLDGSQVLASAGYNAGPKRPLAWRATLAQPVEGAIFAESIPFNETRTYVKNVLSNATYYAALFEGKPQSLKTRLGKISAVGGGWNLGAGTESAIDRNLPALE